MTEKINILKTRIEFGRTYTDVVTGIKGIATIANFHITGCVRICLETKEKNEKGEYIDYWFDEARLKLVTKVRKVQVYDDSPPAGSRKIDPGPKDGR